MQDSISKINDTHYDKNSAVLVIKFLSQSLGTEKTVHKLSDSLSNEDLGRKFYNYLVNGIDVEGCPEKIKLIDFEHPENNTYNVVTELTYQKPECEDNFRPDITLLINGIPLAFIEVKKPNKIFNIYFLRFNISLFQYFNLKLYCLYNPSISILLII